MPSKEYNTSSSYDMVLIGEYGDISSQPIAYFPVMKSRTWYNTPNFRDILRVRQRGVLADLPMNAMTEYTYIKDPAIQTVIYHNGLMSGSVIGVFDFSFNSIPDLNDSRFSSLYNEAIAKLPRKMNGSSFNLPLYLLELHKTIDMVKSAATTLSTAISEYRKLSSLPRKERENLLPWNKWLEYRYGWRLAVKDIYDGLCTIHDIRSFGVRQCVSASASSVEKSAFSVPLIGGPWFSVFRWSGFGTVLMEKTYEIKVTLKYRESDPMLGTLQQLGITNPIGLAWELIPYSFVVDWFIPIGDYLSSLDRFLGKEFVSGCVSKVAQCKFHTIPFELKSQMYPSFTFDLPRDGRIDRNRFYERQPLSSFPTANLPTIDLKINASRAVDAISLLMQKRKTVSSFAGNPLTE